MKRPRRFDCLMLGMFLLIGSGVLLWWVGSEPAGQPGSVAVEVQQVPGSREGPLAASETSAGVAVPQAKGQAALPGGSSASSPAV